MNLSQEQMDRMEVVDSTFDKTISTIAHNIKLREELILQKLEEAHFWAIKSIYEEND